MSEYIGSRISLFSKSDIRYIGTLHQIDSESSTVALENVRSYGTEGRRGNPAEEVPASETIYEYIVFKGSDVKDLTILEAPKENKPPQVPNDPAILGSGTRPPQMQTQTRSQEPPRSQGEQQQAQAQAQAPAPQAPFMPMPYYYPPPPYPGQRFDSQGMPPAPPGAGFPGMPFGPPPGWMYPTPGQGLPNQPRPFPNQNMPFMPMGPPQQPLHSSTQPTPIGQGPNRERKSTSSAQQSRSSSTVPFASSKGPTPPKSVTPAAKAPTPPVESKPNAAAALAPPAPVAAQAAAVPKSINALVTKPAGQIVPAVPAVPSASLKGPSPTSGPGEASMDMTNPSQPKKAQPSQAAATAAIQDATQAATAAVAAAMAKLPPAPGSKQPQQQQQSTNGNVEMLTRKMNEMKTSGGGGSNKPQRHEGPGNNQSGGYRGGRGRGGHHHTRKIEVPNTDYDFESANAKFNKQDLVKEAIATGSPLNSPDEHHQSTINGTADLPLSENSTPSKTAAEKPSIPVSTYNKATSFFDNISSDAKERDEGSAHRPGGREWRGEEQKRNLETFGQGSVDTGYYHHHRGGGYRGRGRGRGGYGGNYRGGRNGGGNRTGGNRGGGNNRGGHQNHRSGGNGTGTGGQSQTTAVVGVATTLAATT